MNQLVAHILDGEPTGFWPTLEKYAGWLDHPGGRVLSLLTKRDAN